MGGFREVRVSLVEHRDGGRLLFGQGADLSDYIGIVRAWVRRHCGLVGGNRFGGCRWLGNESTPNSVP